MAGVVDAHGAVFVWLGAHCCPRAKEDPRTLAKAYLAQVRAGAGDGGRGGRARRCVRVARRTLLPARQGGPAHARQGGPAHARQGYELAPEMAGVVDAHGAVFVWLGAHCCPRAKEDPRTLAKAYLAQVRAGAGDGGRGGRARRCVRLARRTLLPARQGYELAPEMAGVVDTHGAVFVWLGAHCCPRAKEDPRSLAKAQGREPPHFTGFFPHWKHSMWKCHKSFSAIISALEGKAICHKSFSAIISALEGKAIVESDNSTLQSGNSANRFDQNLREA
ncbi:putative villin, partial [Operophtera brumata]